MDMIGRKVGRYQVQEPLGEGGMALVYRAFDPEINRAAALKILKDEHWQDEERMSRFLKEGKAAGVLTHPNIVTIYDVGKIDSAPYILMELLEGKTLGELLQENVRLPMQTLLQIAMQLASALDYAHEKGVVHRDLKPDNIVLSSDFESLKITDFGIARLETPGDKENTQVGVMLGTPRYMSPEQASGQRVDGRSDLFALGVILYELICGRKAFDAESMPTLIMQIVQKDPPSLSKLAADTPVGLQKIVGRLLQKKPSRRFQSGKELYEALERERHSLREQEQESSGYIPLQVKWTGIMSMLVAVAMSLCAVFIFRAQSLALTQQAIDAGVSLSKFVAVQAAIPVLGEDWITLDSFVQDAAQRESFSYLMVADHTGTIRAASDPALVGDTWKPEASAPVIFQQGDVRVTDRGSNFNFSLPVLFNDTVVGSVNMGLNTRLLDSALDTTKKMMAVLVLAVVFSVAVVIYIFNKQIAKNLFLATRTVMQLGKGQREMRISRRRADEFGDLYSAINEMADSLALVEESSNVTDESATEDGAVNISSLSNLPVDDMTVVHVPSLDDK